jgi:DNA-binding winged helix-turn-helix (wHTH) protein/tetratricopeptide (TPR) repeat protein
VLTEFQVGDCRVLPALGQVSCGDRSERLNPKAMEVLLALAEHPGEVLSKESLLERVWPDQFIGDDVLANAIYELRRAFGDKARRPRYIETLHRRGYRLIAPVTRPDASQDAGPRAREPASKPIRPPSRRRLLLAVALLAIAVTVLVAGSRWLLRSEPMLTVSVASVEVSGAVPASSNLARRLRSALWQAVDLSEYLSRPRLFRQPDVRVDAAAVVQGGELELSAQLDSGSHPGATPRQMESLEPADASRLDHFAAAVRLELELRAFGDEALRAAVAASGAHSLEAYRAFESGALLGDEQLFEEAIGELNRAIRLDPKFFRAFEKLARMQDNRGYTQQAHEAIDRAIAIAQRNPTVGEVELQKLELRRSRIEGRAEEQLRIVTQEILARAPTDTGARFNLAWIHARLLKNCAKALRLYADIPGLADHAGYRIHQAEALFQCEEDPGPAVDRLARLAEEDPSPLNLDTLAYYQLLTGRLDEALATLVQRDERDAGERPFISLEPLRGMLLTAQGRYEEALAAIEAYSDPSLGPNFRAAAALRQGQALLALGRPADALRVQRQALDQKPDSIANLWIAALAHLALGQIDEARALRAQMELLFEDTGNHYEREFHHHLAARIHLAEGRPGEAVASLEKALREEHPQDRALFLEALAEAHLATGHAAAAKEALRQALRFNPKHFPSLCALGGLLLEEGRGKEGRALLHECLGVLGEDNQQEPLAALARQRVAPP